MNGSDALKLLKLGSKIRKVNWKKDWYIQVNCHYVENYDISAYHIDYSNQMKDDLNDNDNFKYFDVIEDLMYSNWETFDDDR